MAFAKTIILGKHVEEKELEGGLKVIGAGLPRTGTSSTQNALEQLYGENTCYHMKEVIGRDKVNFWHDLERGKLSDIEIKEHFKSFAATQDVPSILYWEKLAAIYPDAKIVVTTRDFESWYKSISDTILITAPGNPKIWWGINILQHVSPFWIRWADMMWITWYGNKKYINGDFNKANFKKFYDAWYKRIDELRAGPMKGRILLFDVKQGWAPLCSHLGKEVPENPYPNVNDTAQMVKLYRIKNSLGYIALSLCVGAVAVAAKLLM